jgi:hypothetical protein
MRRRHVIRSLGIVAAIGLATGSLLTGCAHPSFVLPVGAGTPAQDAAAAWTEAAASCRALNTFSAELRVSGRAGSQKLKATVLAGVTADDRIRLEVPVAFGRAVFLLAGTNARAVLLTRDNRALTARADQIIEALTGLPFGPRALLAVLSGCGVSTAEFRQARRYDLVIGVETSDGRIFLQQRNGKWRIVAAELNALTISYDLDATDWPRGLRISSAADRRPVLELTVTEHQIEADPNLLASAFSLTVPPDAGALTLEELRASGPLGEPRDK